VASEAHILGAGKDNRGPPVYIRRDKEATEYPR